MPNEPLLPTRDRAYLRPGAVVIAEWVLQSVTEFDAHTCRARQVNTWFLRLVDSHDHVCMVEPRFQAPWCSALGIPAHP